MDPIPDSPAPFHERPKKRRRIIPWLVFLAVLAAALCLHRCPSPPPALPEPNTVITPEARPKIPETKALVPPRPAPARPPENPQAPVSREDTARVSSDSLPFVYADPWGGRHFDSVTVALRCREDCVILYSLEDSLRLRSYEAPLTFRRNTTLWFAGVSSDGRQTEPLRLDYVIEKNPGRCAAGSMPVRAGETEVCMDVYEWPNREGVPPRAMVSHAEAEDSCHSAGKRLCSRAEWREACQGPEAARYPYGNRYDERYCPSQQREPARSGRSPACRSYYGMYDLSGNLWEWTQTPDPDHEDFFRVVGGNWETAEKGTCAQSKYSFYPQNRYPGVGFRCCAGGK